jgi:hypothetical protein
MTGYFCQPLCRSWSSFSQVRLTTRASRLRLGSTQAESTHYSPRLPICRMILRPSRYTSGQGAAQGLRIESKTSFVHLFYLPIHFLSSSETLICSVHELIDQVTLSPAQLKLFCPARLVSLVRVPMEPTRRADKGGSNRHATSSCRRAEASTLVAENLVGRVETRPCDVGSALSKEGVRCRPKTSSRMTYIAPHIGTRKGSHDNPQEHVRVDRKVCGSQ